MRVEGRLFLAFGELLCEIVVWAAGRRPQDGSKVYQSIFLFVLMVPMRSQSDMKGILSDQSKPLPMHPKGFITRSPPVLEAAL